MAGLFDYDASDPQGYSAMETRRQIALRMLAQKRAYPKNIGEGLASIGESIGDVGMMKAMERQAAAQDATRNKLVGPIIAQSPDAAPAAAAAGPRAAIETAPLAGVDDAPENVAAAGVSTPEIPGIVRQNPDGSIAGNITAPTLPVGTPPAPPPPRPVSGMPGTPDQGARLASSFDAFNSNRPAYSAADAASEKRLSDVTGMGGGNSGSFSYAPTASLGRTGDVMSDAPPITGISPAMSQAVGDTVQSRRDGIAQTMTDQTAPVVPQENPTSSAASPPSSLGSPPEAAGNRPIMSDITPMPVAPGTQTAQTVVPPPVVPPPPRAEPPVYEMKTTQPPELPVEQPKSAREQAAAKLLLTHGHDPETARIASQVVAEEKEIRDHRYARDVEAYKAKMQHFISQDSANETYKQGREQKYLDAQKSRNEIAKQAHELNTIPQKMQQEAFQRQQEADKRALEIVAAKEKEADQRRFGRDPEKFFAQFQKEKDSASSSAATLESNRLALKAIRDGVITGFAGDWRLNNARFQSWATNNGMGNNLAANTQVMKAMMTNALGSAVKTINGEGGVGVSNTDVKIAGMASGADPNLEAAAIEQLLRTSNRINARKLNDYEDKHDRYLTGHTSEREFAIPVGPTASEKSLDVLLKNKDSAEVKAEFDKTYGDGAADLEIARAKRREARGR